MMTISIDFLPQNALGHLDTLTPGIAGCTAAQLPKILRMYKQPPDEKHVGNFLSDTAHHIDRKIERFDHFGPQSQNLGKGILPGTGNVKAKFVIIKGIKWVIFLIVHSDPPLSLANSSQLYTAWRSSPNSLNQCLRWLPKYAKM